MPDWKKIADTIAQGMYGEQWDAAKARKSELQSAEQKRSLLQSAEGRAVAGEGRAAQEFEHAKGNWSTQDKMAIEQLKAAGLSNQAAEEQVLALKYSNKVAPEKFQLEKNQDTRAQEALDIQRQQLGLTKQQLAMESRRLGITEAEYLQRKKASEQEYNLNEQINPFKISVAEAQADPRGNYTQLINSLSASLRDPNIDEATAKQRQEQITQLSQRADQESAAWMARRRPANAQTQLPTPGAPQTPAVEPAANSGGWMKALAELAGGR